MILCDHASNALPPEYGDLGLPAEQFERHIAYDIGARAVVLGLAACLGATAILSCYSRLLIDPNRGMDDPTLIMRLSDGAVVPGNSRIDEAERQRRIARFHRPYHAAIAAEIEAMLSAGVTPLIVSHPQLHASLERHAAALACRHSLGPGCRDGAGHDAGLCRARRNLSSATTSPIMARSKATPSTPMPTGVVCRMD